jgi:hypothetical protein
VMLNCWSPNNLDSRTLGKFGERSSWWNFMKLWERSKTNLPTFRKIVAHNLQLSADHFYAWSQVPSGKLTKLLKMVIYSGYSH